jgi:hypothetical protein
MTPVSNWQPGDHIGRYTLDYPHTAANGEAGWWTKFSNPGGMPCRAWMPTQLLIDRATGTGAAAA